MNASIKTRTETKPKIVVSSDDYKRLNTMLDNMPDSAAIDRLVDELERAEILDSQNMPADVVAMHSTVTFTVLSTRKTFTYTLVYPHEADTSDQLSVLTPVGSALLGLSVGQEIEWPLDDNRITRVRIDAILK